MAVTAAWQLEAAGHQRGAISQWRGVAIKLRGGLPLAYHR